MPPVGGLGADTGFQDAADSCETIIQVGDSTKKTECEASICAFEQKMRQRAKAIVEMSSGGAGTFFGMRPISELKPATIWH